MASAGARHLGGTSLMRGAATLEVSTRISQLVQAPLAHMGQAHTREGLKIGIGRWQQVKSVTLILGLATMVKYAARLAAGGLAWFQHCACEHRTRSHHARFVHVVTYSTRMRRWWRGGGTKVSSSASSTPSSALSTPTSAAAPPASTAAPPASAAAPPAELSAPVRTPRPPVF